MRSLDQNRLYAGAGIQQYWVVDMQARCLVSFEQPSPEGYGNEREYLYNASVVTIGGVQVAVCRFFPPSEE